MKEEGGGLLYKPPPTPTPPTRALPSPSFPLCSSESHQKQPWGVVYVMVQGEKWGVRKLHCSLALIDAVMYAAMQQGAILWIRPLRFSSSSLMPHREDTNTHTHVHAYCMCVVLLLLYLPAQLFGCILLECLLFFSIYICVTHTNTFFASLHLFLYFYEPWSSSLYSLMKSLLDHRHLKQHNQQPGPNDVCKLMHTNSCFTPFGLSHFLFSLAAQLV